jgi:hypothetical protein
VSESSASQQPGVCDAGASSQATDVETDEAMLDELQRETFDYFVHEYDPKTGLIADKTAPDSPSSIAAVGLGLASLAVGVERGLMDRDEAARRTETVLTFLWEAPQGREPDAAGYRGFFYHFLDMQTGRRAWRCELSTVDTAFLVAGALAAAIYFDGTSEPEQHVRTLAQQIWERVDWKWALNDGLTLSHGWKAELGFLPYRWEGYSEALLLYILGLASPTHPISASSYAAWASTYCWREIWGLECLYAGPLFVHQLSHIWIDFQDIQDGPMRDHGIDYFENSRRATLVHQQYAIRNPLAYRLYGEHCWGITACDGPGDVVIRVEGIERHFYDYIARGAPYGPDDGTIAPWAVVASLPFAPEIVLPTIHHFIEKIHLKTHHPYGFEASFNPTFPMQGPEKCGWVSPWAYGVNQGPIMLMIENYRSNLLWGLMKRCSPITEGLRRAGFTGGWLESTTRNERSCPIDDRDKR